MITLKRYHELLPKYKAFKGTVTAFKSILDTNSLPLSVNSSELIFAYKVGVFTKLVSMDKGLKMRFDLLKDESVKTQFIHDTVNLSGYDIVTEITDGIQSLHDTLAMGNKSIGYNEAITAPTLNTLLKVELDIDSYLKSQVIDWKQANKESKLATLNMLSSIIEDVELLFIKMGSTHSDSRDLFKDITNVITLSGGNASVDEQAAWDLLDMLERKEADRIRQAKLQAEKYNSPYAIEQRAKQAKEIEAMRKRQQETELFLKSKRR